MPLRRATLPTVDAVVIVILAISSVLSIVCWVVLWRGTDHLVSKVLWTFIVAMPALGPLFFACLHNPPPVQPDVDRAPERWDVLPSGASHNHLTDHHVW